MLVIGLTGGIGCGKTTVAQLFSALGAAIIDTDQIAHQLTGINGAAIPVIRAAFGDTCIDHTGALNRPKMRDLIFTDPSSRLQLERILHPRILAQAKLQLNEITAHSYAILVVPLLYHSPEFRQLAHRVLVVDCDEHFQIERVLQRNNLNEAEVRAIIASQASRVERLQLADDVLVNNGDLLILNEQVSRLHQHYLQNSD